jgi:hypothetical protein
MFGSDRRHQQASNLKFDADGLVTAGRMQDAVPLQRKAVALVREIAGEQSTPSPDDLLMLGGLQYGLGASLLSVGEPLPALSALEEAEQCYRTLWDAGDASMPQLIADVKLRRARAFGRTGSATAAILETDAAVQFMTPSDPGAPAPLQYELDRARLLAGNATILAAHGDPDLAAESADIAVRLLLSLRDQINISDERELHRHPARRGVARRTAACGPGAARSRNCRRVNCRRYLRGFVS